MYRTVVVKRFSEVIAVFGFALIISLVGLAVTWDGNWRTAYDIVFAYLIGTGIYYAPFLYVQNRKDEAGEEKRRHPYLIVVITAGIMAIPYASLITLIVLLMGINVGAIWPLTLGWFWLLMIMIITIVYKRGGFI